MAPRRGDVHRGRAERRRRRGGRALRRPPRAARRGVAGRCGDPAGRRGGGGEGRASMLFSLSGVRLLCEWRVRAAGMGDLRRGDGVERGGARRDVARRSCRSIRWPSGRSRRGSSPARRRRAHEQLVRPGVGGAARCPPPSRRRPNRTARRCARRPRRATPRRPGRAERGDRRAGSRARGGGRGHREGRGERAADRRRRGRAGRERRGHELAERVDRDEQPAARAIRTGSRAPPAHGPGRCWSCSNAGSLTSV